MISLCVRYVALIFVVVFTEFTSTEREQLAFCLGKYEKDSIVKDCVEVSSLFKDIETLQKNQCGCLHLESKQSDPCVFEWNFLRRAGNEKAVNS